MLYSMFDLPSPTLWERHVLQSSFTGDFSVKLFNGSAALWFYDGLQMEE